MNPHASINNEGTRVAPLDLFESDFPRIERKRTIASGAGVLKAGTVLGKITVGGKYVTSASALANGAQTPDAVLAHDVDATAADAEAILYFVGDFRTAALTIGAGHTADSIRDGLRAKNIHI
jgi:hypothetical protein